jgi:hypothetical protein
VTFAFFHGWRFFLKVASGVQNGAKYTLYELEDFLAD